MYNYAFIFELKQFAILYSVKLYNFPLMLSNIVIHFCGIMQDVYAG